MTRLPSGTEAALAACVSHPLDHGWRVARTAPGACATPNVLDAQRLQWHAAQVPGTVAASLHADLDTPGPYDADDWWYRTTFPMPAAAARHRLRFDGLATIAQVWLNGEPILESNNMFRAHRVDVTHLLREENHLAIAFRSLDAVLGARRPRPRWKTALVAQQNLRWVRTTLLGRIPGWTPAIAPVGPWGGVTLESAAQVDISGLELRTWAEGTTGRIRLRARLEPLDGARIERAQLRVGDTQCPLSIDAEGLDADLVLHDAPLWWPHTHGHPALLPCRLELEVDGHLVVHDCGPVGFKSVQVDSIDGAVRFRVNDVAVFCRGAVWTTADILALRADAARLRPILETARDAGINMLRVGGTMTYESDDFHRLCDELGILVWQDFMFANMDYPVDDPAFRAEIEAEVAQQLDRLAAHACVAAYCGGSEIAQQAAMLGLPGEQWCNAFFAEDLPRLVSERHGPIPYFPSSPWGGALPVHVGTGIAHYYGVGAYRRPLADVKSAKVKFATECLGFSNVPEAASLARLGGGSTPPPHHPRWKARVPRDSGSGYDFEDVRDFYLRELFGHDPVELRARDPERYLAVSRAVSGEAMQRTYSEWRAPASGCGGALVWFYRDLWPGAGWGITDSDGRPKAAYWYLKRAWAPLAVRVTDEGLDGLAIHVLNDGPSPLAACVEIELLRDGRPTPTRGSASVRVPAHGGTSLQGDALLGHFTDSTNAYRFGPPKHDVVVVRLLDGATGALIAEDFHFPAGLALPRQANAGLEATAEWDHDGRVVVCLKSAAFLQSVAIDCDAFVPSDNHFHLAPGREKHLVFTAIERAPRAFRAAFAALNAPEATTVRAQRNPGDRPDETR